jgi:hypothetical protein
MEFRYDFGDKLDLSLFKKQGAYYIGIRREVTYNLYLPGYKMRVEIARPDDSNGHMVTVYFYEIKRDSDGEITNEKIIIPLIDTRFKELRDIQDVFVIDHYKAHFDSNSAAMTIEKICKLLKVIHKINNLKAFL